MSGNNIKQYLQENREKLLLVGYFAVIIALVWPISQMLSAAWWESNLMRDVIGLRRLIGLGLEPVAVTILGFFVGLLVLMTIDPKKRWQAFLLWLGLIIGLLGLRSQGLFLPNISFIDSFVWLVGGLIIGLIFGGGRKLVEIRTGEALEFRRASRTIFFLIIGFTIVSFLEYHIQYPDLFRVTGQGIELKQAVDTAVAINQDQLIPHTALSGIFAFTMHRFVQYDAQKNFFILGPRASGKSLFLIGAYLEALDRTDNDESDTPLKPTQDLMSMIEALDRRESEWIVGATGRGELKDLGFQYVHGSVFPTNIQLSGMDYAGEYLSRLPEAMTGAIPEEEMDTTLQRLVEGIEEANTLMFVVDVERFTDNQPIEISEYFSILQAADSKNVMIIATKSDYLAEEFREENGLEPHVYFEEFKEYVNRRLNESENVSALRTEVSEVDIHPVYYQTKVDENGNRVPMRDQNGTVTTVGFDELLERIGRM